MPETTRNLSTFPQPFIHKNPACIVFQSFLSETTYTPQAIVNGTDELVGSDKSKLHTLINKHLKESAAAAIELSAGSGNGNIFVHYKTSGADQQLFHIALVQKKAEINVKRGENSGRKLTHTNVVRVFKTIAAAKEGSITIALPKDLDPDNCIVIAYTQSNSKWQVTGATETPLTH